MDTLKKLSMATRAVFLTHRNTNPVNSQKYLTASEKSSWQRTLPIAVVAATWLISASSAGAVPIQSITLGPVTPSTASPITSGTITYQRQSQSISSFVDTSNNPWTPSTGGATTLTLRRGSVGPNQQLVFARENTSATNVLPPVPTTTENTLNQNNIYSGTDNIFTNSGNNATNNSTVERADFILTSGSTVTASANRAVAVFERGGNTGHDSFAIAAITGVSGGLPSAYGPLLSFATGVWGTTNVVANANYSVLNTSSGSFASSQEIVGQPIGGQVIPLTDLVTANTPIYGYSLFATDVPTTTTGNGGNAITRPVVDFTTYPDTPETYSAGGTSGLDLSAENLGIVQVPFNFSPSLGLLLLSATWGANSLWKRRDRIKLVKPSA